MKKMEDIFNTNDSLSKEDIKNYLSGKLSENENRAIEGKLESDAFQAEAMEGFKSVPNSVNEFEKLEDKINSRINKFKFNFNAILLTLSSVFIIGISILILFPEKDISQKVNTTPNFTKETKPTIDELSDSAIDLAKILPINEIITSSEIIVNSPIKAEQTERLNTTINKKRTLDVIKMKMREAVKIEVENNFNTPISIINSPHIYLHELLIFNYKNRNNIKKKEVKAELSGLPAAYENTKNNPMDLQINIKEIPYNDFLKDALLDFRENNFKTALKNFKVILNQYPNDINALFYGGLCYYNIKQKDKAIEHFEACITHSYSIFEEEANWYKAKSLFKKGDYSESKNTLNSIIEGNGFYSKSAVNLISKIETKINN